VTAETDAAAPGRVDEAGRRLAEIAAAAEDVAYRFAGRANGNGKAKPLSIDEAVQAICQARGRKRLQSGFVWLHCHIQSPILQRLLDAEGVDRVAFDLLSAAETRPRCILHDDAVILNLRGRAVEELAGESDLSALRFYLANGIAISTWRRPTFAMAELTSAIGRGFCPHSLGDFIARLTLWIIDSIEPMVDTLSETIDELEIEAVDGLEVLRRRELSEVRRDAIDLRRFLYPQRDALSTFLVEPIRFVGEFDRAKVHDAHERLVRFIDELEVTRERCGVLHDEIIDNRSIQMNRQILVLSVVSALLLPVSLLAGMLGMNVRGIPGTDDPFGFWWIAGFMLIVILIELAILRWFRIV
jgi:zinc transporter